MREINHQLRKRVLIIFLGLLSIFKLCLTDQLSKWWVKTILVTKPGYMISLTSYLDIVYSWNHGISFGMFSEYQVIANKIFIWLNSIIVLYLFRALLHSQNYKYYVGYGFIIGGAVGNLYDRLVNGAVFDFIAFHYHELYFPIFNLADCYIFLGAVIVLLEFRKASKAVALKKEEEYDEISAEADRIRKLDEEIARKGIK